jgi:hypothetical protein
MVCLHALSIIPEGNYPNNDLNVPAVTYFSDKTLWSLTKWIGESRGFRGGEHDDQPRPDIRIGDNVMMKRVSPLTFTLESTTFHIYPIRKLERNVSTGHTSAFCESWGLPKWSLSPLI